MKRWTQRPKGSNWGDFGTDDQLGRLNLLTPEQVLKGIRSVEQGKVFCLSLPLDLPGGALLNPRRHPPRLRGTRLDDTAYMNFPMHHNVEGAVDVLSDDEVYLSLQYSTQWDSLAHVGAFFDVYGDGKAVKVYYNGFRAGDDILDEQPLAKQTDPDNQAGRQQVGAQKLGIENLATKGIQGRAVLVDLYRIYGEQRKIVGYKELQQAFTEQNVVVEPGDMLVLRTGFAELVLDMKGQPDIERLNNSCAVLDGGDPQLQQWIIDSDIAAICADNYAVEAYPAVPREGNDSALPLHHLCLFKLGLPLAELWYLKDLADFLHAHNRNQFLLTAPPLRLPGAVGSPVTPVATV